MERWRSSPEFPRLGGVVGRRDGAAAPGVDHHGAVGDRGCLGSAEHPWYERSNTRPADSEARGRLSFQDDRFRTYRTTDRGATVRFHSEAFSEQGAP